MNKKLREFALKNRHIRRCKSAGFVQCSHIFAHPEDIQKLEEMATTLSKARGARYAVFISENQPHHHPADGTKYEAVCG